MRSFTLVLATLVSVVATVVGLSGCSSDTTTTPGGPPNVNATHVHDGHAHGPRGGQLLELGNEEYHVDLLLDDKTHTITAHVMDKEAKEVKNDVAVDAKEVVISCVPKDKPETFKLLPVAPDADGKASKFELVNPELKAVLKTHKEDKDLKTQLEVTIGGKEFKLPFEFHHH